MVVKAASLELFAALLGFVGVLGIFFSETRGSSKREKGYEHKEKFQ